MDTPSTVAGGRERFAEARWHFSAVHSVLDETLRHAGHHVLPHSEFPIRLSVGTFILLSKESINK